jgi:hypothetical protein
MYAQQARSAQTPAEADHAVTFTACTDHHTPFVGGFFVLEPRCVPLEIRPAGGRPVREVISFFAGDCWPVRTVGAAASTNLIAHVAKRVPWPRSGRSSETSWPREPPSAAT